MNEWGSQNFGKNTGVTRPEGHRILTGLDFTHINDFDNVIAALPAKAKQAMYAAASARTIAQRTWDGCAFNQAGLEIGQNVASEQAAAKAFGCSVAVVSRFIHVWDTLPERGDAATTLLREKLETIGLFTEPGHKVRIVTQAVYEAEKASLEEFKTELTKTDFVCEGSQEAAELLFAGVN